MQESFLYVLVYIPIIPLEYYLKIITVALLPDFVKQELFRDGPTAISPWRGISQALNPRSEPNDPILFVMYEGDAIRAYLGCLPDWCWAGEEMIRCAWLTSLWVDPAVRGQGLAKQLVKEAMEHWDHHILITEYTPETGGMYHRMGLFDVWEGAAGFRGYIQPDFATLLASKNRFFKRIKSVLGVLDSIVRPFTDVRLSYYYPSLPSIDYLHKVDSESEDFICALSEGEAIRRGSDELNWALTFPWVYEVPPAEGFASERYYFTSLSPTFKQYTCKIQDDAGDMIGFLLWTIREGHLKVRYCYALPEGYTAVAETINYHAFALRAKMVTCLHEGVAKALGSARKSPYFYTKTFRQPVMISKRLGPPDLFRFQSGDGDAVFT